MVKWKLLGSLFSGVVVFVNVVSCVVGFDLIFALVALRCTSAML